MNKLEILKSFLNDDIIREKYFFSETDIAQTDFVTPNAKPIVELLRHFITVVEDDRHTDRTASTNLHTFLENLLRQK